MDLHISVHKLIIEVRFPNDRNNSSLRPEHWFPQCRIHGFHCTGFRVYFGSVYSPSKLLALSHSSLFPFFLKAIFILPLHEEQAVAEQDASFRRKQIFSTGDVPFRLRNGLFVFGVEVEELETPAFYFRTVSKAFSCRGQGSISG